MKIYLSHQITGLTYRQVADYYISMRDRLRKMGYSVFYPFIAKEFLKTHGNVKMKATGVGDHPVSKGHAIIRRDRWMVLQSDIVFVNLIGIKQVSIGCTMELAWAYDRDKHTVLAMEESNPHQHDFVRKSADIRFQIEEDAIKYLEKLIERGI